MTEVESHQHETDAQHKKKRIFFKKLRCAHPKTLVSRRQRCGPKSRCDLWLFDSSIQESCWVRDCSCLWIRLWAHSSVRLSFNYVLFFLWNSLSIFHAKTLTNDAFTQVLTWLLVLYRWFFLRKCICMYNNHNYTINKDTFNTDTVVH